MSVGDARREKEGIELLQPREQRGGEDEMVMWGGGVRRGEIELKSRREEEEVEVMR